MVEEDSIDVFHMPLKLPNDHAILVKVDYEAEVTMTDPKDFLEALTVWAAFPDGLYALKNPFKELNWAVNKVE